ncbi:MAG TPA: hypothetical protein VLE69_03340 [Candidatus Saccharimonadales bacterium]|nr:hypothetical protein [Candidatus Saccharimonadales bacterium]
MQQRARNSWNTFWRDKDGKVAIWQSPNIPLLSWVVFLMLAKLFTSGQLHRGFAFLSTASIFIWSYLEITSGKSYFRRLLGLVVLLSIIVSRFK